MNPKLRALLILGLGISISAEAQVVGTSLNIGTSPTANTVGGQASGALGASNTVSGANSLGVGYLNSVTGAYSGSVGYVNSVGGSSSLEVGAYNYQGTSPIRSLLVGTSNSLSGGAQMLIAGSSNSHSSSASTNSVLFGQSNNYSGTLTNSGLVGSYNGVVSSSSVLTDTLVAGHMNTVEGGSSFVAGESNVAKGLQKYVLGRGLIADQANAMVALGTYNVQPVAGQILAVRYGISSATADRKNALEVYSDGKVTIPKRQGDIKMGAYGPAGADN